MPLLCTGIHSVPSSATGLNKSSFMCSRHIKKNMLPHRISESCINQPFLLAAIKLLQSAATGLIRQMKTVQCRQSCMSISISAVFVYTKVCESPHPLPEESHSLWHVERASFREFKLDNLSAHKPSLFSYSTSVRHHVTNHFIIGHGTCSKTPHCVNISPLQTLVTFALFSGLLGCFLAMCT